MQEEPKTPQGSTPANNRAEYQNLVRYLKKVERRLRIQQAVRLLPYAILAGSLIGLTVAIISRVTPSFTIEQVTLIALPALCVCVIGVLLYAFLRPRKLLQTARQADVALDLKERLSTAIEGHLNPDKLGGYNTMGSKQFSDASRAVQTLTRKVSKAIPLQVPRREGLASLAVIPLLVVALVLPNPFSDQVKENEAVKAQIKTEAQKIEQLKQQIEKQNPEAVKNDPKTQELLKQLEQVEKDLLDKSNNKDEALAALQKAEQELQNVNDPNKSIAEKAALDELARSFNSADLTKPAGQALQSNSSDRFDKAAQELEKLANDNTLQQLKNNPQQAQQLSDKLAKDAQNFKNANPQMSEKLQNLASSLNPNNLQQNSQGAQQALKDVAQQLRNSGQDQQVSQQMQEAQSQLQKSEQAINQAAQKGNPSQNGQQSGTEQGENGDQSQIDPSSQNGDPSQPGQLDPSQPQSGQQGNVNPNQDGSQSAQQPGQQSGQQPGQQGTKPGQQGQLPGQGNQGSQGNQPGQQGDQGQQPGQGGDQGDQGNQEGQNGSQGDSNGQNGSQAGKGSSDSMFANPTMRRENGTQTNIQGKDGQGPTQNQTVNGGNPSGEASVPYSDVLDSYQQQAAQQLDKNYIPITLKDQIKQYFEDLNKKSK